MTAAPSSETSGVHELDELIARCHDGITKQSQGHPEPFLALWSHADDVSIMAAIGGYQVGFDAVSELLTAASKTQTFDTWSAENLVTFAHGDLGFTVELEHYGKQGEDAMTLRATQIYRREANSWRVIHRHGDVLTSIEAKW